MLPRFARGGPGGGRACRHLATSVILSEDVAGAAGFGPLEPGPFRTGPERLPQGQRGLLYYSCFISSLTPVSFSAFSVAASTSFSIAGTTSDIYAPILAIAAFASGAL